MNEAIFMWIGVIVLISVASAISIFCIVYVFNYLFKYSKYYSRILFLIILFYGNTDVVNKTFKDKDGKIYKIIEVKNDRN